ncbi:MAG: GNAT family N-acetyltransferase [Kangiellaceae bacterium]|nr:GNAT family N-acetyltransferase [Kangiellaceae bacterium]MCW8999824.1 GNAT family N-acetyltransferase [Kangiellaceae bacterium]MCW9018173.1 GNAT family N-acetyltransferase [Kangiellaceae bacterium]
MNYLLPFMLIRSAIKSDCHDLAELINLAGDGIPEYIWSQLADSGQLPIHIGAMRAMQETSGFSYTNAKIIEIDGKVAGGIISYQLANPYSLEDLNDYPKFIRPLIELEAEVAGSWYINAIATFKEYQSRGLATEMIKETKKLARKNSCEELSLIVSSENTRAINLYQKVGFNPINKKRIITPPHKLLQGEWILMRLELTQADLPK